MKTGDSVLQRWRVQLAARHIQAGAHVLDVGCSDGALFRMLRGRIGSGLGIDPEGVPADWGPFRFIRGAVPEALPQGESFDCVTMLAVLEHLPPGVQRTLAAVSMDLLKPGGRVICTVPSPAVDTIIHLGQRLRVLEGMAAHEHYGFQPNDTIPQFVELGFVLSRHRRFQLGLNNLFVFTKPAARVAVLDASARGRGQRAVVDGVRQGADLGINDLA